MSESTTKRRRHGPASATTGEPGNDTAPEHPTMAEMKAMLDQSLCQMERMQNEMDSMKQRLEGRCQFLESRCGCLERSLQAVIKKQKWDYSAPNIPASHWTENGFDEEYVVAMEQFLQMIKNRTIDLRHDEEHCNYGISLDLDEWDDTIRSDFILLFDDVLLPHWVEFADSLQLFDRWFDTLGEFCISNIQLPSKVLDVLTPALKMKKFNSFQLRGNSFDNARDGINFAIEYMQSNPNLTRFEWGDNSIHSMDEANRLLESIISIPSIYDVTLENVCDANNGYNLLCSFLARNENITRLGFASNSMRTMGDTQIQNFLKRNSPLRFLDLRHNHINDNDVILIAEALKHNTTLGALHLLNNDFTEIGKAALLKAVFDGSSLNSVADSNHSCFIGEVCPIPYNQSSNSARVRLVKIYSLLVSRNREGSNVYHLNLELKDDCLKLAPMVLERIHHCYGGGGTENTTDPFVNYLGDDYAPLAIFYEVLRSWKMPSLYENHRRLDQCSRMGDHTLSISTLADGHRV